MGTIHRYLDFFVFGCHAGDKALIQPCSIAESKMKQEDELEIREKGTLKAEFIYEYHPTKYEINGVITVTHETATESIQKYSEMKPVARVLMGATLIASIVSLLRLRSTTSYTRIACTIFSTAGFALAFFRHQQINAFENKASQSTKACAEKILEERKAFFSQNIKEPSSKILHHLEAEFIVKKAINAWLEQLKRLRQDSPQEKQAYVEHFLKAPFNEEKIKKVLDDFSITPSPLLQWYQQSVNYIQKNDKTVKKYNQDLIDQRNWITGEIPHDSTEIQDQLENHTYIHFWNLALKGAAACFPEIKPIWDHQEHQLDLCKEKYAIYYTEIKQLVYELENYLSGLGMLLNSVQISNQLNQSFENMYWPRRTLWNSKDFLKSDWFANAKEFIPTLGTSQDYQNFLLRLQTKLSKST